MELMTPELYVVNRLEKIEAQFEELQKNANEAINALIKERDECRRQLAAYQQVVNLVASDIEVNDTSISLYISGYTNPEKFYAYKQYFKKPEETAAEDSGTDINKSSVTEETEEVTEEEKG